MIRWPTFLVFSRCCLSQLGCCNVVPADRITRNNDCPRDSSNPVFPFLFSCTEILKLLATNHWATVSVVPADVDFVARFPSIVDFSGEMVVYEKIVLCGHVTSELSVTTMTTKTRKWTKQKLWKCNTFAIVDTSILSVIPIQRLNHLNAQFPCASLWKNALIRVLVMNLSSQSSTSYYCVCWLKRDALIVCNCFTFLCKLGLSLLKPRWDYQI